MSKQLQGQFRAVAIDGTNYTLTAGTSDVNSAAIDTQGFHKLAIYIALGAMAASSTVTFKLQHSDASGSGYEDIAGSSTGSLADTNDDKSVVFDVEGPMKRYYRVVTTRGDAGNTTILAMGALLGSPRTTSLLTAHTTNASTKTLVEPISGTA